jgi:hypothetical protein
MSVSGDVRLSRRRQELLSRIRTSETRLAMQARWAEVACDLDVARKVLEKR